MLLITLNYLLIRSSASGDKVALKDEVLLCAVSCLGIFKAVSSSYCNFQLLLDCLHAVATCISLLGQMSLTGQDERKRLEKIEHVVEETFDFVKRWLKKSLNSKIPCYSIAEAELELEVLLSISSFNGTALSAKLVCLILPCLQLIDIFSVKRCSL